MVDPQIGEIVHMPTPPPPSYFGTILLWDLISEERHEQSSATVVMVVNAHNCAFLGSLSLGFASCSLKTFYKWLACL